MVVISYVGVQQEYISFWNTSGIMNTKKNQIRNILALCCDEMLYSREVS